MSRRPIVPCLSLALAGILAAAPAVAEPSPCSDIQRITSVLDASYGELPVSRGLQANGQLMQFFASPTTGTWTAVTTRPDGLSCVVATGQYWANGRDAGVVTSKGTGQDRTR